MSEVGTIAVIGAGALGRSLAQLSALGGFSTILEDILPASLDRAGTQIRAALGNAVADGALAQPTVDAALGRIEYASSVEQAARSADLVIEAVPDELESKIEIFTLLDKVAKPATILVSTSALFSVTELASMTYRAKKILGMRFSLPIDRVRTLEIIRGQETDDATFTAGVEVARRMGLKVVMIEEERSTTETGQINKLDGLKR